MKSKAGLWIDHKKAIVVTVTDQGEQLELMISKAEKQLRRKGDSPLNGSFEALQVPSDNSRQRALTAHLNKYYDAVIDCIRDAESVLIFGPGEAKEELRKRIEGHNLGKQVVATETADKMTNRQIAARVKQYFAR